MPPLFARENPSVAARLSPIRSRQQHRPEVQHDEGPRLVSPPRDLAASLASDQRLASPGGPRESSSNEPWKRYL